MQTIREMIQQIQTITFDAYKSSGQAAVLLKAQAGPPEAMAKALERTGGQQQRVAIARALASDAQVILADEPTGNLDEDTAAEIAAILKDSAHKSSKCVVIATHSNELAKEADVVFQLQKGELQIAKLSTHN